MASRFVLSLTLALGLVVSPLAALSQPTTVPTIGFLRSTPAQPFTNLVTAFRQGLKEAGFVEGQNVAVEYRHADNQPDRLPRLVEDLIRRGVAVIVCNTAAAAAAKAATRTVPIVFVVGSDPVQLGLVPSLARPGGNLTGVTFLGGGQLAAKRLELLNDLAPKAGPIAVLQDPTDPGSRVNLQDAVAAARALGRQIVVINASTERDFEPAFGRVVQAGAVALLVGAPLFTSHHRQIVALTARHGIPAIYDQRDYVGAGGLISYSASFTGAYRQAGVYAGRILKGAKPAELPVQEPTTLELAINLKTAKALGLTIPPSVLARADEVIE
ncbi:MAG TPA: ABC transporter substrate-binding protein [Methylomirabilota bacterium]